MKDHLRKLKFYLGHQRSQKLNPLSVMDMVIFRTIFFKFFFYNFPHSFTLNFSILSANDLGIHTRRQDKRH